MAPKANAKFVSFEGIEGSGKSTQIQHVSSYFSKKGMNVLCTREPGGTDIGNELRTLLLQEHTEPIAARTELFLMEAARAQHVEHVIRPALEKADLILCDRFSDASVAYQGGGRNLDKEMIHRLNDEATQCLKPDLTFLFDMDTTQSLARAVQRNSQDAQMKEVRFENEKLAFHERVREAYLQLAKEDPQRFHVLDADQDESSLSNVIIQKIEGLLIRKAP